MCRPFLPVCILYDFHLSRFRSLEFYSDLVGEFWYELEMEAQSPAPTTLPHMECELGK